MKGYKIFWCQAKDDISAKDIFRLQKGTSKDRAIIAKYCLQDCTLCNKLMAKLCVITNNVGMANVCHVPLSYIFYRGQGIKIFSLVAKKCREKNHLIPVLEKKKPKSEEEKKQLEKENTEEIQFDKFIKELNNKGNDDQNEETEDDDNDTYEGATVFPPEKGVHFDPVPVLDYASLYPRSMILKNLSHEFLVVDDEIYGNLPGYKYHYTTYMSSKIIEEVDKKNVQGSMAIFKERLQKTILKYKEMKYIIEQNKKNNGDHVTSIYDIDKKGQKRFLVTEITINKKEFRLYNFETSKFAEKIDGSKGIIPEILQGLLDARENTKKQMDSESDKFKKSVLDGKQLAEKVTANSLYGQTGSPVSAIFMKEIAASTTATGKQYLEFSRDFLEGPFNKLINLALDNKKEYLKLCKKLFDEVEDKKFVQPKNGFETKEQFYDAFYNKINGMLKGYHTNIKSIYGDTDSVFYKPQITDDKTGEIQKDKRAREWCIQIGIWSSIAICLVLPVPMSQQYEKVLHPFAILTKKRYVGNLYEKDPNKFYTKSMGIVLKRRDNAPIVKVVVGGIVDQILNKQSAKGAVEYTKKVLRDILSGKYSIDKFIITKTLKGPALNKKERDLEERKDKKDRYYAERSRIVHAVLADRIADRDYGNKPQSNDRIAYVYRVVKGDVELQGDRVETPEYILENNLQIDYLFYITNQIMKPAVQFLELLIEDPEKIFEEYIIREENRRKGQKTIKSYCSNLDDNDDENAIDLIEQIEEKVEVEEYDNKKKKKTKIVKGKKQNKKVNTSDYINFEESDGGFNIIV